MTQSPRHKQVLIVIGAIAVLVSTAALLRWQLTPSASEPAPDPDAPQSAGTTPESTQDAAAETGDSVSSGARRRLKSAQQTAESARPAPAPPGDPWTIPHDVAMADYKAALWEDIRANPPEPRDRDDPDVDADLAYRLYTYYANCSVIPRTEREVSRWLERIADNAEHAGDRYLKNMERRVDETVNNYELCYLIPLEVDCRLEAVHWITRAVELGHDVAEVQFYQRAMGFILRPYKFTNDPPLVMKEPGLVSEFKDTARRGLARAMEKGHPEAYLANAQALLEGLIYPKNPMEAYAYARAAELSAARTQLILEGLDYWKNAAARNLGDDQLAEAESLALDLQSLNQD